MAGAYLTLAQVTKLEQDVLKKYVLTNLLREIKVMEILPFTNVDALKSIAVRWTNLPSVAFRYINSGYTGSTGDVEQVWEAVYGLGGEFNFDRVFEKIKNTIVDPVKTQMDMKLMSLALTWNDYFINGDAAVDPLGFEGLLKRVTGMPTRQSVYFAGAAAAALDPTGSVANGRAFFDKLEEMHYKTNRGQVSAAFCNEGIMYGLGKVARYINIAGGNILDVTKDSFDRQILTYKGARIIDMGLKTDQTTEIITETELAGDAASDATSIYMASFDEMQGVVGIQLSPPEFYDPLTGGERESLPAKMRRLDWWNGLASFGSFGITRGRNFEGAGGWT